MDVRRWLSVLDHRFRSVTPFGRSVAAVGVLAWAAAARWGWEEMSAVAVACFAGLLIGAAFLFVGGSKLAVLLRLDTPRVVAGEPAATTVVAANPSSRRLLPVRLETRVGKGVAHVSVPSLAPGAEHDELFVIPTKRRSVVPVGPVRSVQGDPLGLVRREVTWTGTEHLFVHPRTVTLPSLTSGWMRDLEGEATNDRSPSDVAFHTLREYVVGDDRRHIHWRTTARQPDGKLMVREFVDTRRAHVGLVLSLRSEDYASDDEFELAVSALASFGLRALADEQELTCLAGRRLVPAFHGTSFLDTLSALEVGSDDATLAVAAAQGRDALGGVSLAVVVTGSRADAAANRAATDRIGSSAQKVIVSARLGAESAARASSGAPMIELGELADLPRLAHLVSVR